MKRDNLLPEVRGSLVKSGVSIDYEDMLPINATFEMAEEDISKVSRVLLSSVFLNVLTPLKPI